MKGALRGPSGVAVLKSVKLGFVMNLVSWSTLSLSLCKSESILLTSDWIK